MLCDLHVHSHYSDGTLSPKQIIDLAKESGLTAVALCDHNTVCGLNEFNEYAKGKGIISVSGCEISTEYHGVDVHILALFIPENKLIKVTEFVAPMLKRKAESNKNLIDKLNQFGYKVSFEKLTNGSREGNFNRANIAAELLKGGYVKSVSEAMNTVLSQSKGFYEPPIRIDAFDAVRFIKSIGAVPVLAHPLISLSKSDLYEFLPEAIKCGLVGMETIYSTYSRAEEREVRKIAVEFGLKQSGGSDFHGYNKPDIMLGKGKGNLKIPYDFCLDLKPTED